jgi:outer membrane lipoprotein LolB
MRNRRHCLLLAPALLLLSACAQKPLQPPLAGGPRKQWNGRLSLRVDTDPVQSMAAGFDLRGTAAAGELSLYTPLGSTLARLLWSAGTAELQWNGQRRNFDSMDALTTEATGTALPIAGLFQWLNGAPAQVPGWSADLAAVPDGKLLARRTSPAPTVELRLIFE